MLQGFRKWHKKWSFFSHSLAELAAACTYSPLVMEKSPNDDVISADIAIFALVMFSAALGTMSTSYHCKKQTAASKHHLLTIAGSIMQITLVLGERINPEKRANFVSCAYGIAFLLNQTNAEAFKSQFRNRANNSNGPEMPTSSESDNKKPGFYSRNVFNIHCILSFCTALMFIIELSIKKPEEATKTLWVNVALLNAIILSALYRIFSITALKDKATKHEFLISHINTTGFAVTLLIPVLLVLRKDPMSLYQSMSYFVGQSTALLAHNFANMLQHDKDLREAQRNRTAAIPSPAPRTAETTVYIPGFFGTPPPPPALFNATTNQTPDANEVTSEAPVVSV